MEQVKKKQELSNTVRYPLVLVIVCLVCGGILGVVNYITAPKIEAALLVKKTAAMKEILTADGLTQQGETEEVAFNGDHPYLNLRAKVHCTDSNTYFYYDATSPVGYAGGVEFGALVNPSFQIIGYKVIDSSKEDTIGQTAAAKISYSSTVPFNEGDTIASGATGLKTLPAIQTAFEAIIADAKTI
ncbi:MAG: hypothetical protein LKJ88_08100 [Bacilli bacterium]|jgi:Na+-translocating ferredoxin:NAD+ oxidoreductase RnfG subunit|nr:hypothetical protein [Bacilli bacterium]